MYHATKNMKSFCSTSLIPIYWFCIKNLSKRDHFEPRERDYACRLLLCIRNLDWIWVYYSYEQNT
jgi:hypothetical protein